MIGVSTIYRIVSERFLEADTSAFQHGYCEEIFVCRRHVNVFIGKRRTTHLFHFFYQSEMLYEQKER